jgi:tetratricopeptide (TPR) repeat protein
VAEGERELRARLERDPTDGDALRELVRRVGTDRDGKREVVELWRRHVEAVDGPDEGAALLGLARSQVAARQEEDAIETLGRCVERLPDSAEAHGLLGELLRRAGRLEAAVEALSRATDLDPDSLEPRVALVACYDALGREREARAALESIRDLGAGNPAIGALVQELMHRRA